jgi:hypothetical protein
MRYILDDLGYIEAISCTFIECSNKSCTEYTGAIPEGYETLDDWVLNANIRAYKIVDNNLVYDEARAAELEAEWVEYPDGDFSSKVDFNETYANIHFYKKNGIVTISYQGEAKKSHAAGNVLFTIPKGYRPLMSQNNNQFYFPIVKNEGAYGTCFIRADNGQCVIGTISSNTWAGRIYLATSYVCE